jgi:recombination protein RecR
MANQLAKSIVLAKRNTRYCEKCFTITDKELCPICASEKRNGTTIMVVEQSKDLAAYERTREFKGLYHVLQGAISPMIGVGPNDIKVRELLIRLQKEDIVEVILATSSTAEGEATATYHSMLIKPIGIKVTRIANGVPVGGDLEYIDEITLLRALEGRIEL